MAKNNTLVGGSVPLQLLDRVVWKDEPLLLYQVERDYDTLQQGEVNNQASWIQYLKDIEGYKFTSSTVERRTLFHRYLAIMGIRPQDQPLPKITITIVASIVPPILSVLQLSDLTALANCFGWNEACSLCPLTTFVHRNAFVHWTISERSFAQNS